MARHVRAFVAALCVIACCALVLAQSPSPKSTPQNKKAASTKSSGNEANPLAEARRQQAISLIMTLADEARGYRDQALVARVQARAADVLWETDQERARALFRRAWDAADAVEIENARRAEEERRAQAASGRPNLRIRGPNLRSEVLRLAARRDRALGEEFLAKLDAARKLEEESGATKTDDALSRLDPSNPSTNITQRLDLARRLLESNETERALQFADPVLNQVTMVGLEFLSALRGKDAAAADKRYLALLAAASADPSSDANTASLLSAYIFTPHMYITIQPDGGVNTSQWGEQTPPAVSAELRNSYLRVAAQILMRPLPPPDQDRSSGGRSATFFIISRLLPLFEKYMPERGAALRAQLSAVTPDVPEDMRNQRSDWLTKGLVPEENESDELKEALEQAERARTPEERDNAYARAALAASRKGDVRARDYADKIEDSELRKKTKAYTDYELVRAFLEKKDANEALRIARLGELTHVQRVWVYTEAAGLLIKANDARVGELLNEAADEARRIGGSDPDRTRALVAVATRLFAIDRGRAWEMMAEVVKASNATEGFTGEDGRLMSSFESKFSTSISSWTVETFDLVGIFRLLAKDDLSRAVELAKSFTAEAPRAAATIAIARSVLDEKPKAKSSAQN